MEPNKVVIDTHALFWFVLADKKLSNKAKNILDKADEIIIPTIVLLELFSLMKKQNLLVSYPEIVKRIIADSRIKILTLDIPVLGSVTNSNLGLDSHDAVIVATSQLQGVPLITKDKKITEVYKNTIW